MDQELTPHGAGRGITTRRSRRRRQVGTTTRNRQRAELSTDRRQHRQRTALTSSISNEEMKLRAVRDFNPKQMSKKDKMQLTTVLKSHRLRGKEEEIEFEDTLRGGLLMEYLSATKQLEENYELQPKKYRKKIEEEFDYCYGLRSDECLYEEVISTRVNYYSSILALNRGDTMMTIPPTNIGDSVGWWKAMNFESGKIGFIPRNCVVIEHDEENSKTRVNELPLEVLDVILENSFLQRILNGSPTQRDGDVIKALASVAFCWFQRTKRRRFKQRIWYRLEGFNRKIKRIPAVIRNNRDYLLEYIQPSVELITSLSSLNCITEKQRNFIDGQRSTRDKNAEILNVVRSVDNTRFSNFVRCLRQINHRTLARILDCGGVVVKVEVQHNDAEGRPSAETLLRFHQNLEGILSRTKPWSHQTYGHINRLKKSGIEILNCQLDRKTVVVWIWCLSQAALDTIQKMYESNQLRKILTGFAGIRSHTSGIIHLINIDCNQFKKAVVMCQISINFSKFIGIPRKKELLLGVTKLRNKIYVLSQDVTGLKNAIRVFEDRNPFRLLEEIKMKQRFATMFDIGSSEKDNCLYVADGREYCVWKIMNGADDKHKIIKWLITDYRVYQCTLSVSSVGNVLIICKYLSNLNIYGSDAEHRSIQLPQGVEYPVHAVETSIGYFMVLHEWMINEEEGEKGEHVREGDTKWVVSEITRDGQMVIRRFIPLNEIQKLIYPSYLALDSDDQVFVADSGRNRIVFLDSNLKWNRILCPTMQEDGIETHFQRICYDEEQKQLIGTGQDHLGLSIYTLSRK